MSGHRSERCLPGARKLLGAAGLGAAALTVHAALNPLRPAAAAGPLGERVSLLLPVRDEVSRVAPCLHALLAALDQCAGRAELVVLDDGSTDGTAEVVGAVVGADTRVRLLEGEPLAPGWLGKPHACAGLAAAADPRSTVLVFLDADVLLAPDAVLRAVVTLRGSGLDLISPYPRQTAVSAAERLVQPLLQWSWLTFLPLARAEVSRRPSLTAANGQFLVVDRAAYERAGGHAAVRQQVLEDVALARAVKAVGGRGGVVDGTELATCRMYDGWRALRDGYGKSLWAAFGSPAGAAATVGLQVLLYVAPALAAAHPALRGPGLAAYAAGVAGRVVSARRTGGRAWPDPLAHPVSIALFGALVARSWREHRRGSLSWKGRPVTVAAAARAPVRRPTRDLA